MFTISKQGNQYSMTDDTGNQIFSGEYTRAPKARRGVLTVTGADGSYSMTERMTEIAVYAGAARLFRVSRQPDIHIGRGRAHIQIAERGIFCDGTKQEGYTIYTQNAALGSLRPARVEQTEFLACDTSCGALELLALAFWLLRG